MAANLFYVRAFAEAYTSKKIVQQLAEQIISKTMESKIENDNCLRIDRLPSLVDGTFLN
jgi:hypothetical protein